MRAEQESMGRTRASVACALALAVISTGCDDSTDPVSPTTPYLPPTIVSDPATVGSDGAPAAVGGADVALVGGEDVVYVSLAPGSFASATGLEVRNAARAFVELFALSEGGLDPVPVPAQPGDLLRFSVYEGSIEIAESEEEVPARAPPVVVRTHPPKGKRDVPVSLRPLIVFSEPMDSVTLLALSLRLFDGGDPVPGTAAFTDPTRLMAEFVPAVPLTTSTAYELVVARQARDLDGESLANDEVVTFVTMVQGLAVHLEFVSHVPPTHTIAGLRFPYPLTVLALDGDNNELPLFNTAITLSLGANPTGATLVGTTMHFVTSGIYGEAWHNLRGAHFDDVRIDRPGRGYTLVASAPGVQAVESVPFDVVEPGELIVFDSPFGLSIASPDGYGVARLLGSAGHWASAWSPDGERIVTGWGFYGYGAQVGSPFNMYVMNADGTGRTGIGEGATPAWSPDGATIAFVRSPDFSGPTPTGEIHLMNAGGSGSRWLTYGIHPAWSPDGEKIAFVRDGALFTIGPSGAALTRLADAWHSRPAWSPDGSKIAFGCATTYRLCLMNPDGSNITQVSLDQAIRDEYPCEASPSWSPDGTRIAFVAECGELSPSPIAVVELATGDVNFVWGHVPRRPSSSMEVSLFWPAWRPAVR